MIAWAIVATLAVLAAWHRIGQWLEHRRQRSELALQIEVLKRAARETFRRQGERLDAAEKKLNELSLKVL